MQNFVTEGDIPADIDLDTFGTTSNRQEQVINISLAASEPGEFYASPNIILHTHVQESFLVQEGDNDDIDKAENASKELMAQKEQ